MKKAKITIHQEHENIRKILDGNMLLATVQMLVTLTTKDNVDQSYCTRVSLL